MVRGWMWSSLRQECFKQLWTERFTFAVNFQSNEADPWDLLNYYALCLLSQKEGYRGQELSIIAPPPPPPPPQQKTEENFPGKAEVRTLMMNLSIVRFCYILTFSLGP